VKFVRSYVEIGREIPETGNVTIRYATDSDGVKEEEFDLVVLGVGLGPPAQVHDLADQFGIELNEHGFCQTNPVNPIETSRPGVFVSGAFQGPMDIPESVMSASGTNALAGALLRSRRGKLDTERIYPEERDVSEEEIRVGVFTCHCGANIGRVVDIPEVTEYSGGLPHVAHAEEGLFICSTDAAAQIADTIREKGLNRVVVAACTPRTHEPLFRDTLREGGINQYFFDMANIREHCSWVHSKQKEEATAKAKDIIRMSVARTIGLEPLQEFELPVNKAALVVGGGVAGMNSALGLANQGFEVHLVEKEEELGGMARRLQTTLEGVDVRAYLEELVRQVYQHPLIHVFHGARITDSSGYVGNFMTTVDAEGQTKEIHHGVTILATGAEEHRPTEYLYGEDERVCTQLELEEHLAAGWEGLDDTRRVVMIQCVGCREEGRDYCARICCSQAIKNALALKARNPEMDISILYRDMRTYGFKEDYYREAAARGVRFVRWEPEERPEVEPGKDEAGMPVLQVTVPDPILGQRLALDADLVVLSVAAVPSLGNPEIARLFKVPVNPDGFFQEAHVKLRPVDFGADGVFMSGANHYPKHLSEAVTQAYGAAGRAVTILSQETVTASGSVCEVQESACIACGACIDVCTYDAIGWTGKKAAQKAKVNPALCKGDGLCCSNCPTDAIVLRHYTNEEVFNQIDAALSESWSG
jgi:heterodisulfide reductase subunit A